MTRLYNRNYRLTLAKHKGFFSQEGEENAIVITEHQIVFDIEKHVGKKPNTAAIDVYNLAERTRSEIQDRLFVRLEVGYDGELWTAFQGDLHYSRHKSEGADWITRLEMKDGGRAFKFARLTKSMPTGVKVSTVVNELAAAMELDPPRNLTGLDKQFVSGLAISGNAGAELDRVLTPLGKRWSIQDGRLQILGENEVRRDQAIVLSPDNGLIGSPELGAPEGRKKPPIMTAKSLLQPGLTPGALIAVTARGYNGAPFKIIRASMSGDFRGTQWEATLEAKAL